MRRIGAHLVFIDESGLLLAPLLRRTWSPLGETPILKHQAKHREKVSVIAALSVSPERHHLGLYFTSFLHDSIDQSLATWFLRQLLRHLRGRVVVVCDRGPMHHGPDLRALLEANPRLEIEYLPPYAPELNPVEQIWNRVKWTELANFAPGNAEELEIALHAKLNQFRDDQECLLSFFRSSELPWPELSDGQ